MSEPATHSNGTGPENTQQVNVGHSLLDTRPLPTTIDAFDLWDCPNHETVVYQRDYTPTEEREYPKIREKIRISTRGSAQWDVTRSVHTRERTAHHGVVDDQQCFEPLGVEFERFKAAFQFACTIIEAKSARDTPPRDVKRTANPYHRAFRDIRLEEAQADEE